MGGRQEPRDPSVLGNDTAISGYRCPSCDKGGFPTLQGAVECCTGQGAHPFVAQSHIVPTTYAAPVLGYSVVSGSTTYLTPHVSTSAAVGSTSYLQAEPT